MTTKPSVLLIRPDFFQDRMFQNDYNIPPIGLLFLTSYIIFNVGIIIGNPTEDLEDLKMTQDFLMNTKATAATILSFVPFPGTSSYEDYKIKERFPEIPFQDYFTHYPFINLSKVPTKEILKMKRNLLFKFYLQPWRIFRLLWLYPNYKVFIFNVLKFCEFMLKVGEKAETSENIPIEKGKTLLTNNLGRNPSKKIEGISKKYN